MRLVLTLDPEGTYCCHPTPRELREWTIEYNIRERGSLIPRADTAELDAYINVLATGSPAIYPSLSAEDSDEERVTLDTDDPPTLEAHRRYTSLTRRAATTKDAQKLKTLREEWMVVKTETRREWNEVSSYPEAKGRDGQRVLNREAYEVSYCHRDPSDWQLRHETPEVVRDQLAHKRIIAGRLDIEYTSQDAEQDRTELLTRYRRKQIAELWKRHFAELGADAKHGRLITRWNRIDGRWVAGASIGREQFIASKIKIAGDELAGLQLVIDSLVFRITKKRERAAAKAA